MGKVDFIELAEFCTKRYKELNTSPRDRYVGTLYVAILEDNQLKCSTTPHVLKDAVKCMMIHERSALAETLWHPYGLLEFIDSEGRVHDSNLGNDFNLTIYRWEYDSLKIELSYKENQLFKCGEPFDKNILKIWNLYTTIMNMTSVSEMMLVVDAFEKDERILELERQIEDFKFTNNLLERERDQYKDMLDEIKELLNHKNVTKV